ncbi:MAG: N-acetylneuraminate synthase [Muribaculaceae bacterium]|nr:N-acetylneuraminate synthase [Muribaculaceae bacterium]
MVKDRTIIIAEAGVNHNGSLAMALRLVEAAAEAGADYVKFQTFRAENLVTAGAAKAEYQQKNTGDADSSQLAMLKALELSEDDFRTIARRCRELGIGFLSTPFDFESIDFLATLGQDFWKIPSGEITDYPYLCRIAALGQPVVMSTGMSTLGEVAAAVNVLTTCGLSLEDITLLHCTTMYPTPYADVNLRAMATLASLGVGAVGYSDHTPGIAVPMAAVALGAKVIEKHFTLDRTLPGPDHRASLEPDELAEMVRNIRQVEAALGTPDKRPTEAERPNIAVARRSIVAARAIEKGEPFTAENLTVKRPATGLSPMRWTDLIGRTADRPYAPDEPIRLPQSQKNS